MEFLYSFAVFSMNLENKEETVKLLQDRFDMTRHVALGYVTDYHARWYSHYKGTKQIPKPDKIKYHSDGKKELIFKSKV